MSTPTRWAHRDPANLAPTPPQFIRFRGRQAALVLGAMLSATSLLFAGSAQAATAPGLGTATSFSVLAGSTVTNTGPTTMWGDLGLAPGSSVTGAPNALGTTHIDDAVAVGAQNDLVTAYNAAAGQPASASAGTDLSGQSFTPGVYNASSSLLFSAGSVTLNAQGNPNAVFIFQVGSSITTGSATTVLLTNGAQACNVFWQVGASVTLGSNSTFAGTVMAYTTITAGTGATLNGRLLARTGAVNLNTNTITTSTCATTPTAAAVTPTAATTPATTTAAPTPAATTPTPTPIGSKNTTKSSTTAKARAKRLAKQRAKRLALKRAHHTTRAKPAKPAAPKKPAKPGKPAKPASPNTPGSPVRPHKPNTTRSFTG